MFTIIVAYDRNRGIGKGNAMPWHIPKDLKLFKERTLDHPVVMGRNTWFSLPEKVRPLPKRVNIVVSRTLNKGDDYYVVSNLEDAIDIAEAKCPGKEILLIGGSMLYASALGQGLVSKIIASEVKESHDVDSYFPPISDSDTITIRRKPHGLPCG